MEKTEVKIKRIKNCIKTILNLNVSDMTNIQIIEELNNLESALIDVRRITRYKAQKDFKLNF